MRYQLILHGFRNGFVKRAANELIPYVGGAGLGMLGAGIFSPKEHLLRDVIAGGLGGAAIGGAAERMISSGRMDPKWAGILGGGTIGGLGGYLFSPEEQRLRNVLLGTTGGGILGSLLGSGLGYGYGEGAYAPKEDIMSVETGVTKEKPKTEAEKQTVETADKTKGREEQPTTTTPTIPTTPTTTPTPAVPIATEERAKRLKEIAQKEFEKATSHLDKTKSIRSKIEEVASKTTGTSKEKVKMIPIEDIPPERAPEAPTPGARTRVMPKWEIDKEQTAWQDQYFKTKDKFWDETKQTWVEQQPEYYKRLPYHYFDESTRTFRLRPDYLRSRGYETPPTRGIEHYTEYARKK